MVQYKFGYWPLTARHFLSLAVVSLAALLLVACGESSNLNSDPLLGADDRKGSQGDGDALGVGFCGEYETTLTAGQHINVGKVKFSVENDILTLDIITEGDWYLAETHVLVTDDLGDVPTAGNNVPVPGLFPHKREYSSPYPQIDTYIFDLAALGIGPDIFALVHAAVLKIEDGQVTGEETAWGGEEEWPSNRWAFYIAYTLEDCTPCLPYETDLTAGQHIDVGKVRISVNNNILTLDIFTEGAWYLDESHIFIGTDVSQVPTASNNAPIPGQFPYSRDYSSPYPQIDTYTFDLDALGIGPDLVILVHASVLNIVNGQTVGGETAWGGEEDWDSNRWAFYIEYTVNDCGDTPDGDEPDGDEPDGDEPDGDEPDGDEPDGDEPDGDDECVDWVDFDLGPAADFNVFSCGDYHGALDIMGKVAVANDASFQYFSIAYANQGGDALIVGNALSMAHGTVYGNAIYGATLNQGAGVDYQAGGAAVMGSPIDFAAACAGYTALSGQLASIPANAPTVVKPYSLGLELVGTDPVLNVFTVDAADLAVAGFIVIDVPAGSKVLINVAGVKVSIGNLEVFAKVNLDLVLTEAASCVIVWNFFEATELDIRNIGFKGTALAPLADTSFNNGNFAGTLITGNLTGNGEFHNVPFCGSFGYCLD